ncbi:MAG: hypothetical protein J6H31_03005 [Butyrivibrio sp.]|nr:hypothetical protein [Butyrivibrio sp.]
MKLRAFAKNSILLLLLFTIVVGGIFFDAHESLELSDWFGYSAAAEESQTSRPLKANSYVNYNIAHILSAAEIKDVSILGEVIKKLERSSSNKRIVILTLILCFFLSIGTFFKCNLPSIFPWTSVICSRSNIMLYIHEQDGLK